MLQYNQREGENGTQYQCAIAAQLHTCLDDTYRLPEALDSDAGECHTMIDGEDNVEMTDGQYQVFKEIINAGMDILGRDEDGCIDAEQK